MKDEDKIIMEAMESLKKSKDCLPTKEQKDIMLSSIMNDINAEETSKFLKLEKFIFEYPWRAAFSLATVQSIIFTMIFSTSYTNLFL